MKKENYESSIRKWKQFGYRIGSGDFKSYSKAERDGWWDNNIWTPCGFCNEFAGCSIDDACAACPLAKKHCYYLMPDMSHHFTMKKVYHSFINGDDETTLKLIKSFIRAMNRYKNYEVKKLGKRIIDNQ